MSPTLTPTERITIWVRTLTHAVAMHTGWDLVLTPLLIGLITDRLRTIKWRIIRIAARVEAGGYRRRVVAPHRRAGGPRPPSRLPRARNWLEPLLPEVAPFRGGLEQMLHDPAMIALVQAAPEAMGRPLRSLCWMLGMRPPPMLARPRRAALEKAPPTAAPEQAPRRASPAAPLALPVPAPARPGAARAPTRDKPAHKRPTRETPAREKPA